MEPENGNSIEPELSPRDERPEEPAVSRGELPRPPLALFDELPPRIAVRRWKTLERPGVPVPPDHRAAEGTHARDCLRWLRSESYVAEAHELPFTDPAEREKSVRFAMNNPNIDAVVIGMKSSQEVDENIKLINAALAA